MTGDENKRIYRRYIELLNAQRYDSLHEVVDPERYREICVGFTQGWVDLPEAVKSLEKVVTGIPDLHARIDDCISEGDKVYARLTVTGTNLGRFYGIPASGGAFQVSMFDYAKIEDGRIVERVQQSDTLSQMRQMYAGAGRKAAAIGGIIGALALLLGFRQIGRA